MATTTKRWAVRQESTGIYLFYVGRPRKIRGDWRASCDGYMGSMESFRFLGFFPECYHLEPGGGPVEIRFEKVPA